MLAQLNIGPFSVPLWHLIPILGVSVFIPLVLHLLSSVRAPQIRFSTLRFLRLSMEKTARRRRIQHWLLLLLRTALLCLLLLAVTQPLHRPRRKAAGGGEQGAVAIVVDNSLSMAAADGPRRRFDTARHVAKELIRGTGKPKELALIFTNGREAKAAPMLNVDLDAALRRLDAADVGLGAASMVPAVGAAVQTLRQSSLPNRAVYVLSDLQAASFRNLATCKALAESPDIPLLIVNCGRGETSNIAVADVGIKGHGRVVGATIVVDATVTNSGPEPRRAKVCLEVDGRRQDHLTQNVLIASGGTSGSRQKVSFEYVLGSPGPHSGRVFIDGANDLLPADDSREFALHVSDRIRVLVIAGPGGAGDPSGPGYFVAAALKVPSAVSPLVHPIGEVKIEEIRRNDVVICCDVPRFDEALAGALRQFVADGRTLLVFVGPNVDAANYNAMLGGADRPVLPAVLGEPVGDPVSRKEAAKLLRVDMDHPVFRDLYETQEKYQSVLVYCHLGVAMSQQRPASILAWLERDHPLLLERRVGGGRCLLFTTSANTAWSNLPTKPIFLPVLVRICLGATDEAGRSDWYPEGAPVRLNAEGDQPTDIDVVLPADEAGRSATVRVRSRPDETGNTAVFTDSFTRGVYAWHVVGQSGKLRQFVVSAEPSESDLEMIGERQLAEAMPDQHLYVAGSLDELHAAVHEASRGSPLWDYFLIAVLVMTTVAALFANRYRPAEVRMPERSHTRAA